MPKWEGIASGRTAGNGQQQRDFELGAEGQIGVSGEGGGGKSLESTCSGGGPGTRTSCGWPDRRALDLKVHACGLVSLRGPPERPI
ncbi:hypothetical protein C4D60_Mb04t33280 [Musa balbisiana]|uniref:Uncharacterized protein n=1 Tax=Musa balbisiana TaxID=52838 RepID=A0A4S8KGM4_MUSBA|nr:hypothetical protein C4D60_Mb04t33280 [Musa balbisiana]